MEKHSRLNYRLIAILLIILSLPIQSFVYARYVSPGLDSGAYAQPSLANKGLQIKSVDTQIVSKHWENVSEDSIDKQATMIRDMGANYIAISTPYDYPDQMKIWVDAAHDLGLNVWFRSHWLNWEGEDNHPRDLSTEEYLNKTAVFIQSHPSFFRQGDAFTVAVEPEQIGVGSGSRIASWDVYNQFIQDQIDTANKAFSAIGLGGKVHTNWISMNGWVVEKGLKEETVRKMGLITVDHYPPQSMLLPPEVVANNLVNDLDRMNQQWNVPIILGEWGYNIEREVSDFEQRAVVEAVLAKIRQKPYLVGFNYWAHMGNSSRIINDKSGSSLALRPAAVVLRDFYLNVK